VTSTASYSAASKRNWISRPEGILFLLTCALPFLKLGLGEFQSWDECLYLIRADACFGKGLWWDQSSVALGGFYSASHPPLAIWIYAVVREVFGTSVFMSRLPSAVALLGAIIFLYKLAQELTNTRTALLSASIFGCSQSLIWFGEHAQLDSFLLCFSLAALYCSIKAIDQSSFKYSVISGLLFAAALLSKFLLAFYALPFFLLLPYVRNKRQGLWKILIALFIGSGVAGIWYISMYITHGDFLSHAGNLATSSTYDTQSRRSWWFYINQLILNSPFVALLLLWVKSPWSLKENRLLVASLVWLAFVFLGLTFAATQMHHFTLLLLPSSALVVAASLEFLERHPLKQRVEYSLLSAVLLLVIWSSSEQLRLWIKGNVLWHDILIPDDSWVVMIVLLLVLLSIPLLINKRQVVSAFAMVALLFFVIQAARQIARGKEVFNDGAEVIASQLQSTSGASNKLLIASTDYPHEDLVPQLHYYTNGFAKVKSVESTTWHKADSLLVLQPISGLIVNRKKDRLARFATEDSLLLDQLMQKTSLMFGHHVATRSYDYYY